MGIIRVRDLGGEQHEIEAIEGWRVMEIIRQHGFDIEGLCGGACACATCHVTVDPEWTKKLHPANDEEEAMLDGLPKVEPTSRLSCQLIFSEALNGLTVSLAPAA
jgi:ferredoxin, 2Fe-2S